MTYTRFNRLGPTQKVINRLTTNRWLLEGCVFFEDSRVRSSAIHCALRKSCRFYIAVLVGVVLCLVVPSVGVAQNGTASLSGRVIDTDGNPVDKLPLAVKPVEINMGKEIGPLAPLASWPRGVTDAKGRFSISNIEPVSSRLVMFPEHGARFEMVSVQIGDLTFNYRKVDGIGFPMWLGQLTFAIEPGESLENVVVKVRPPDMRIRGRVLLRDRTPPRQCGH